MEKIGASVLPIVIGVILIYAFIKEKDVFDLFVSGAKEGMNTTVKILPALIGLLMAVNILKTSGLLEALCSVFAPFADALGISSELVPLALLRPISGSGSSAYVMSIFKSFGPDSETGKIASVLSSATETTFYAVAVYFGATKYKKLYYTVPIALIGDMVTIIFAVLTVKYI
jgi:Uncharacterized membrane protein